jgi:large subunit ribosomal protein L6
MLKMKIKILVPKNLNIKLYKIIKHHFVIFEFLKSSFFFKLNQNIQFIKIQNKLFFNLNKVSLNAFLSLQALSLKILSFFNKKKRIFCKKILLQGLGFKIVSMVQNKFLELKIGYSHFVKIFIPAKANLTLYSNKNMIIIEGLQKDKVGNFANKIKSFRIPDNYKGKGI